MSRSLDDLLPHVRALCVEHLRRCDEAGIRLMVTFTFRTFAEQEALYQKGRTTPGEPCRHGKRLAPWPIGTCPSHPLGVIVTKARGGHSWHEFARAYDVAPLNEFGKPHWPNTPEPWESVAKIGEALGLTWGFRVWGWDRPHFHVTGGMTLAEARGEWNALHPCGPVA